MCAIVLILYVLGGLVDGLQRGGCAGFAGGQAAAAKRPRGQRRRDCGGGEGPAVGRRTGGLQNDVRGLDEKKKKGDDGTEMLKGIQHNVDRQQY